MIPFVSDVDFTLYVGDVLDVLRELPDEHVQCCVTSPPYWGLRDYGTGTWEGGEPECDHKHSRATADALHDGTRERVHGAHRGGDPSSCGKCGATRVDKQLGLEPTPEEYVARMVGVFAEVRRVLRKDGTLWLNLGDSFSHGGNGSRDPERWPKQSRNDHRVQHAKAAGGTRPKDMVGIPWRVAFGLQADGWYLRSDIIWSLCAPSGAAIASGGAGSVRTPLVYIAGPYSKPDPCENTFLAVQAADRLVDCCAPLIPHLSHFWHTMSPKPYETWLALDLHYLERCDALLRLPGDSSGADAEIVKAIEWGIPVFYDEAVLRDFVTELVA